MQKPLYNFIYDDHTSVPFRLIHLKPSADGDKNTLAHRHNYYELFIFTEGGGQHWIDFESKEVLPQMAHIVPPGSVHLLRRDAFTKGFVLLFSRDFYHLSLRKEEYWRNEAFLSHQQFPPNINLEENDWFKLLSLIAMIEAENKQDKSFQKEMICHYLNLILYILIRNQKQINSSDQSTIAYQFLNLLNQNFHSKHKVKDYAEMLQLSSDKLNNIIKIELAKTASEVIKERLFLESKRLLMHTDSSMKEIAYELGMEPTPFTRWIKTQCSQSPKELRQTLRALYF